MPEVEMSELLILNINLYNRNVAWSVIIIIHNYHHGDRYDSMTDVQPHVHLYYFSLIIIITTDIMIIKFKFIFYYHLSVWV